MSSCSHAGPSKMLRRLLRLLAVSLLSWFSTAARAADELAEAIAEADRLDPGWRLDQIMERRTQQRPADENNSALQVHRVIELLTENWPANSVAEATNAGSPRGAALLDALDQVPLSYVPPDALRTALSAELAPVARALAEARKLATLSSGQTDFQPAMVFAATPVTYVQRIREVARLLEFDTHASIARGDSSAALDSTLGLLNAARSIGDEPTSISQLVRLAIDRIAVRALQRLLAHRQIAEQSLARLQKAFLEEAEAPRFVYALRGERAGYFDFVEKLATGRITIEDMSAGDTAGIGNGLAKLNVRDKAFVRHNQALGLRMLTEAVELAKKPYTQQHGWDDWEKPLLNQNFLQRRANALVSLLLPAVTEVGRADRRVQCLLRSAGTALACERFRQANGEWPSALNQLVPKYLTVVPIDPYTGKPLTLHRLRDGLAVYGLGLGAADDHGNLHPKDQDSPGYDTGVRLFDIAERGSTTPAQARGPTPP